MLPFPLVIAYLDPPLWVLRTPRQGSSDAVLHAAAALRRRDVLPLRNPLDQHVEAEPRTLLGRRPLSEAWEDGRHRRAAQRGPRLVGKHYERVCGQSKELLYAIPAPLCEEIARAATAELTDHLSIL